MISYQYLIIYIFQLVCEMLNTCGNYYVRGVTREKLKIFLVYFQRYLLCKPSLPAHVEYSVLDVMDYLEQSARVMDARQAEAQQSKKGDRKKNKKQPPIVLPIAVIFNRYDSYENAQAAIDLMILNGLVSSGPDAVEHDEEEEEEVEEDENEGFGDQDKQPCDESIGSSIDKDEDEDEEEDEDDNEEEEEEEEDTNYDEEDGAAYEDDSSLYKPQFSIEEEEEFDKAFRDMMIESIESVKAPNKSILLDKMAIPSIIPKVKKILLDEDTDEVSVFNIF